MKEFSDAPIRSKLIGIMLISISMALIIAGLFLFFLEFYELRNNTRNDIQVTAKLIGNRSTAALVFGDQKLAVENLETLMSNPSITNACILNTDKQVFAKINLQQGDLENSCMYQANNDNAGFGDTIIHLNENIILDDDVVGLMYIRADMTGLYLRKLRFLGLVGLVFVAALFITFIIFSPMLKAISGPILRLVETVQDFTKNRDYSIRVYKEHDDELGQLVTAFNGMLDTLEEQNHSLVTTKNHYLALYDGNPTMVIHADLEGRIVSVNRFGAQLLGLPAYELEGQSIFDITYPEDIHHVEGLLSLCVHQPDQVHKHDIRNIRGDGETIWVRQSARLLVNDRQEENVLIVSEDVTETRKLTDKIAYQASHDALTDLVNRTEFENFLKKAVEYTKITKEEHALCYLDLDQFKVVNDTCGHIAGDELLRQLSTLLKNNMRQYDILARLGGDEFGILIHDCTLDKAVIAVEKIRVCIQDFNFAWEGNSFSVGVSIGVTTINSTSGNHVELLKEADSACFAAKDKGRNRVHIFHPDDEELAQRQGEMQWVGRINRALDEQRLCLFGQIIKPINDQLKHEGYHFETLLRLKDHNGNIIPPGAFLPSAERYNLSPTLDRWVCSTVLEWLAGHPDFLQDLSACSINLSGLSLSDETFLDFIINELSHWSVVPSKICFEITETAAISNLSNATKFINKLKKEGCLFSLDDFGSGLSSFGYLKNLPVDFLKIDGLFVKNIESDPVDLAMVRSINEVGHVIGKKTIAEFVENQNIIDILKEIGVDYVQGYCIGKPVPLEELLLSFKAEQPQEQETVDE